MDDCQRLDAKKPRLIQGSVQLTHGLLHERHTLLKVNRSMSKGLAAKVVAPILLSAATEPTDKATSLKVITAYLTEAHTDTSFPTYHTPGLLCRPQTLRTEITCSICLRCCRIVCR
jgi:hypothetical protein